jgi:predicted molibdopterin-dependent oxidoreductase YjgC
MGIEDGDFVRVTSRRGSIELKASLTHRETRGSCFIPFHFREAAANLLTIDEIDPFGKIPEFKFCAVRIDPTGRTASRSRERARPPRARADGDPGPARPGRRGRAPGSSRGRR